VSQLPDLAKIYFQCNPEIMATHPRSDPRSSYHGGVSLPDPPALRDLCSANRNLRIHAWLDSLPPIDEMVDMAASCDLTSELYKDWLDWSQHTALTWLLKLDKLERYLRRSALRYHKTPYKARHATIYNDVKLDLIVLRRLSEILETDQPREQQPFFNSWYHIHIVAADILDHLENSRPLPDEVNTLRLMERDIQLSLARMPLLYYTATEGLAWLQEAVRDVAERAGDEDCDTLSQKYSRQGGLLHRWMLTLPELTNDKLGRVEERAAYIEWYVKELLATGVEQDTYWSSYTF
jgi:hypothetical protein